MDGKIAAGIVLGIAIGTSALIWESKIYTHTQKIFLMVCIVFPPLQWGSAIVLYLFNFLVKDTLKTSGKPQLKHIAANTTTDLGKSFIQLNTSSTMQTTEENTEVENFKPKVSLEKQRRSLDELKRKGILSDTEHREKSELLFEKISSEGIKKLDEYYELLNLRNSDLLSEEQFNSKVTELKKHFQGFCQIYGNDNFSKFNWNLYQSEKLNEEIDPFHYRPVLLIGSWQHRNGKLVFWSDIIKTKKGEERIRRFQMVNRSGTWELKDNTVHLRMQKIFGSEIQTLKIISLGSDILEYIQNGTSYKLYKLKSS